MLRSSSSCEIQTPISTFKRRSLVDVVQARLPLIIDRIENVRISTAFCPRARNKKPQELLSAAALGAYLCWALKARLGFRPLIFEWHSMSGTFENARIGSVSYVAVWFRPSCDEDRCRHIDKASECRRCCGEQCPVFYPVLGELCAYLSRALGATIRSSRRNIGRI